MKTTVHFLPSLLFVVVGCSASEPSPVGANSASGGAGTGSGSPTSTGSGGASTGTAGAGSPASSGGGGAHVVTPCGDIGDIGVWEATNPVGIPIPSQGPNIPAGGPTLFGASMLAMNPKDNSVFVAYDHKGIHKSTDCGATWSKINTGKNGSVLDVGSSWSMVIDPVDTDTMYANNGYGDVTIGGMGVFKSMNGGVDWEQTMPSGSPPATTANYTFATRVSMDPTNHLHLVASFHSGCKGEYAPDCLAETTDGAATWKMVKLSGAGAEASGIALVDSKTWLYGATGAGLWLSKDAGGSWVQVSDDGGYLYYRSKAGVYYMGAEQGVLSSTDLTTWTKNVGGKFNTGIASDGELIYVGMRYCGGGGACYVTSPENDGKTWTDLKTAVHDQGGLAMAYDPDHKVMFSANEDQGVYRARLH